MIGRGAALVAALWILGGAALAGCAAVLDVDEDYVLAAELGSSCARDEDCVSGHCVDEVCCVEACSAVCLVCDGSFGADAGRCDSVAAGSDPDDECRGSCDGAGACED